MDEFDFIATHLAPLAGPQGLGLIDDAALLTPSLGKDLILTKDTMVESVHFPKGHYGGDTAEKLLRVNLSDLAAKGARPIGYMLSIAWPTDIDKAYYGGFAKGLRVVQDAYDFKLIGGDTVSTDGPMIVTATLIGEVPKGKMVTRNGAQDGDDVWVTGTIGDAYLGLQSVLGRQLDPAPSHDGLLHFEEAYYRPEPRLVFCKVLRQFATASVDVSDGLMADIAHISTASSAKIIIDRSMVPLSPPAKLWLARQGDKDRTFKSLVTGGDDYELVFTAPQSSHSKIQDSAKKIGLTITKIGTVQSGEGVSMMFEGRIMKFAKTGHKHF